MVISRASARSLYTNLRSATLEAIELASAPGDDFGTRSGRSDARLQPGNFHLMLASAGLEHERFTLLVLGCEAGRSLLRAARYPWRKLVGVARSRQACSEADRDLRSLLRDSGWPREVEVVLAEAGLGAHPLPPGPLVLVLEDCGSEELSAVVDRLERSLRDDPRELVVFASPEQAVALGRSRLLRAWRGGEGWRCLVGRAEQPRARSLQVERDPMLAPRWEMQEGVGALEALAPEWDELARRGRRTMVADSIWARSWCEGFLREGDRLEVHSLRRPSDGRLLAVLPLLLEGGRVSSTRRALFNANCPYWGFAVDESSPAAMRSLLAHLLQTHDDADLVELPRLHRGGFACEALLDAATELGLQYQLVPDGEDTCFRLGPWRELEARLPSNVRKHVPRKLRRLREQGAVSFTVSTGGPALDAELSECFELEAKGWKGEHGSPIRSQPETLRFYTQLAKRSAAAGRLALYLLRLDGKLIAFEYCLRGDRRIDQLKLSYDPVHAQVSPGLILRLLLLEREAGLGEIATYHMGLAGCWQIQWASSQHPLCTLRIFAPSLKARALGAGPALASSLKLALHGRPRLLSAVRWGRAGVARLATAARSAWSGASLD